MDEASGTLLWQAVLGASDVYSFGDGASIGNGVVFTASPLADRLSTPVREAIRTNKGER